MSNTLLNPLRALCEHLSALCVDLSIRTIQHRDRRTFSRTTVLLFLVALGITSLFAIVPQSQRVKYNFNSDWLLNVGDADGAQNADFTDSAWKHVTLPHAWNEDDAFRK